MEFKCVCGEDRISVVNLNEDKLADLEDGVKLVACQMCDRVGEWVKQ